jgi:hypothetical protein
MHETLLAGGAIKWIEVGQPDTLVASYHRVWLGRAVD